jgi:hypothetical protein
VLAPTVVLKILRGVSSVSADSDQAVNIGLFNDWVTVHTGFLLCWAAVTGGQINRLQAVSELECRIGRHINWA